MMRIRIRKAGFYVVISIFLCFLLYGLVRTLRGYCEEGYVNNITNIPYVGKDLKDFPVYDRIYYYIHRDSHRIQCLFTGTISEEKLRAFCSAEQGWEVHSGDYVPNLRDRFCFYDSDPLKFPIGISSNDIYTYNNDNHIKIEISYRAQDNHFTAFAMRVP